MSAVCNLPLPPLPMLPRSTKASVLGMICYHPIRISYKCSGAPLVRLATPLWKAVTAPSRTAIRASPDDRGKLVREAELIIKEVNYVNFLILAQDYHHWPVMR